MSDFEKKEITYKVFNKSSKKEAVRYFSLPKITSFKPLKDTIQNICKPKKDFRIYWTNNMRNKIPIECDEELKAAQEIMIKKCRCRRMRSSELFPEEGMEKDCSGCGNIVLYIKYLKSGSNCLSFNL